MELLVCDFELCFLMGFVLFCFVSLVVMNVFGLECFLGGFVKCVLVGNRENQICKALMENTFNLKIKLLKSTTVHFNGEEESNP